MLSNIEIYVRFLIVGTLIQILIFKYTATGPSTHSVASVLQVCTSEFYTQQITFSSVYL